jgi:hypothetical protein
MLELYFRQIIINNILDNTTFFKGTSFEVLLIFAIRHLEEKAAAA